MLITLHNIILPRRQVWRKWTFFVGGFRYESHLGFRIPEEFLVGFHIPSGQMPEWFHHYVKTISF